MSALATHKKYSPFHCAAISAAKKKKPDQDGKYECPRCHGKFYPNEMTAKLVYCRPCRLLIKKETYRRHAHKRRTPEARERTREKDRAFKLSARYQEYRKRYVLDNRDRFRVYEINKIARRRAEMKGRKITVTDWHRALRMTHGLCFYCSSPHQITMDHFQPLVRGGAHGPENILPACKSCNSRKQALDPEEWFRRLEKEMLQKNTGSPQERVIKAQVFLALGTRQDIMLWNNPVGVAVPIGTKRTVKFGTKGAADILGCQLQRVVATDVIQPNSFQPLERKYHFVYGQAFAIETKTHRGKQSEEQKKWQAAFERVGGLYILARDVEDVVAALGEDDPQFDVERVLNSHRQPVK